MRYYINSTFNQYGMIIYLKLYNSADETLLEIRQEHSGDVIEIKTKNMRFKKELYDDDAVGDGRTYFYIWIYNIAEYDDLVKFYNDIISDIELKTKVMFTEEDIEIDYNREERKVTVKTSWAMLEIYNVDNISEDVDEDEIIELLEKEKITN